MGARVVTRLVTLVAACGLTLIARSANAQELGHRIPGTLGIHAGDQSDAGLYVAARFADYFANSARDRNGAPLVIPGFDLNAAAGAIGIGATLRLPHEGPYLTASAAVPIGHTSSRSDRPEVSVDRYGVGDVYLQPVRVGVRNTHFDVSASYAVYIPTGWYDANGTQRGISSGQTTQEFSAGGSLFVDAAHTFFVSALGSFDLYGSKRNIDITRGASVQVQGGAGMRLFRVLDVGLAGYALWQVSDDTGTALPMALRGARDVVYGVGPEIDALIPPIHAQLTTRYAHDFGVRSRPEGQLFFVGLTWRAWAPHTVHHTQ